MTTFAELFQWSENAPGKSTKQLQSNFPILNKRVNLGYTRVDATSPLEEEDIINLFYLLMHYKGKETDGILLIDPRSAAIIEAYAGVDKSSTQKNDLDILDKMKPITTLVEDVNNRIVILPIKDKKNHWFILYKNEENEWGYLDCLNDSNALDYAQMIAQQFDEFTSTSGEWKNKNHQEKDATNSGFYTILYILAVATMSTNDIQECLNDNLIKKEFLATNDLAWIKEEIPKLYNLRYQVDKALTGPMKKIIVTKSNTLTEDNINAEISKLQLSVPKYRFSAVFNPKVYGEKSWKVKVRKDKNKNIVYELLNEKGNAFGKVYYTFDELTTQLNKV